MRKLLIASTLLVGLALALFFLSRSAQPEDTGETRSASAPSVSPPAAPQAERPEEPSTRGTLDAGSTPALAALPSEVDGVLEVELLAGARPLAGATVRLYWRGPRDPNLDEVSWRLASTDTTDEQGRARLASGPGSYLLAVRAQAHAPLLRHVVRPYGEARTHLRLTLEPGQTLTGRTVSLDSGEPLPLVELVLTAHGLQLERYQSAEAPPEERVYATSDARGSFRMDGLAPGTYQLEARAPGHAREVLPDVKVPAPAPLTVALRMAGVIEGFVVDAQGQPAPGAEVQVNGREPQTVTTGAGGGFSLEVEAGTHTVSARRGSEAGTLDRPVLVSAGKTVRDVRVRLGQGATVEGRVVADSTRAPVAGASVDVSPYGEKGDSGRATTDVDGRFVVGGLAPGGYDVVVSAPGFSKLTRQGLTMSAGERFSLELALKGTGAVQGHVRDGAGRPIPGVRIGSGALGTSLFEARTDGEGHYRLEGLSAGYLFLIARREDAMAGASQRVAVKANDTATADFTLEETGTVEGVVRTAQGARPPEPMEVRAYPRQSGIHGSMSQIRTEVDAAGTFQLTLPPGPYELLAIPTGPSLPRMHRMKPVEVAAGKTLQVELIWKPDEDDPNALTGHALEPDGAPASGAFIQLRAAQTPQGMEGSTIADEAGRFSVALPFSDPAAMGALRVDARRGTRVGIVQGLKPGTHGVVVKLRPSASLEGRVVRTDGAPVQGFTLLLASQEWQFFMMGNTVWEFPGDRFELRDIAAETVKVVVTTPDGTAGDARVSPEPGGHVVVEISLKTQATVSGRVLDAQTQAPVTGAFVFVQTGVPSNAKGTTGSDGRFTLKGVPPGEHTLVIRPGASRPPERRPVTVREGQVLEVGDVLLSPPRAP
ncbi:carboxypeptidase regulatory-like domain-containing protein [Hyalangium rubrum]|uniref:Carboxypeptidase regulatory-like domain-containing protein n=1 Tax=Hyalangium rubrum TaxID=3103134 RepID=A0ABU5H0D7_9BACT|nr:carboxypeptidase regulatory-like domain-containing protein [Hyalangium sp. s54d21]MDY7226907.1 carboxypeptidase regulatory-like domain-containing protein [Hyalangium sp. s54d21]